MLADKYSFLPASQIADRVNDALRSNGGAVVTAPPGAGKSTLLPLTILEGLTSSCSSAEVCGKILMLEPRRLAVRHIAERMASMLGEDVGETIGYRVRFEKKVSERTRVEVLTEGILTRMLTKDAALEGVEVVIFDEYHERSINTDLALALTRFVKDVLRPDLKIVIMSATIDADDICNALRLPLIESRGKMFPVKIVYSDDDVSINEVPSAVASAIRKAYRDCEGSILAFLPGQSEIQKCASMLETLDEVLVCPLYGNLSPEQQRSAIAQTSDGRRKIVLATPIAETSLTIEGIRIVVDSGLHRMPVFDGRTGLSHLDTVRITKDMAAQRAGRAGRLTEGVCYRLWTKVSEHAMTEQRTPEICYADLSAMLLCIAAFGESDAMSLPWITAPERDAVFRASTLLQRLGAIDASGILTQMGKQMVALPCHPRVSRMMLRAGDDRKKSLACDIAALLEEKDVMSNSLDTDITLRISELRKTRSRRNTGRWNRIARVSEEYHRMMHVAIDNNDVSPKEAGELLAYAYPERIAKAMDGSGAYRLASGDNVYVDMADSMSAEQWIVIASAHIPTANSSKTNIQASRTMLSQQKRIERGERSGRVFLAAPLDIADVDELIIERDNVSWDGKEMKVIMQRERRVGRLLIDSKPVLSTSKEHIVGIICEATKKDGLSMFDWSEEVQRLQRRVAKVAEWHPEYGMPNVSTEYLMQSSAEWLPMYVEINGRMATSALELKKINMCDVIRGMLYNFHNPLDAAEDGMTLLDRLAPSHVLMPTGRRIPIDYRAGAAAPIVSVRLQECFGMEETPTVNDGRESLLLELLSPGYKPVQLTQDLRSFWNDTYFDVRKELKRRYPKHYWPDNPLTAEAVSGVKR